MCFGVPGCFGALRARFQAGSFTTDGTIREFGVYRGWFSVYGVNLPRGESISRKVRGPERNLPRWESISRTVRSPKRNRPRRGPISRKVQIPEGEPSTLEACIADGSGIRGRTVHAGGRYHGRFGVQSGTFHAGDQYRGWFNVDGLNRPC